MDQNVALLVDCLKEICVQGRTHSLPVIPAPVDGNLNCTSWKPGSITEFFKNHGFTPHMTDELNSIFPAEEPPPQPPRKPVPKFKSMKFSPPRLISEVEEVAAPTAPPCPFRSAKEQLLINDKAKGIKRPALESSISNPLKKSKATALSTSSSPNGKTENDNPEVAELMLDERMKNADSKMVEAILNEVIEIGSSTDWDDVAGLAGVKEIIREIIIWPLLRPDIFQGLRGPPKGILLFGPPGTGKTMIGRLIATQSSSTFFNISASSLTSKWIGDGEKMVRTLFQVARCKQPAVIFIDEIDSILTQRSDTEHESSRRLKTEFLIQFDGCGSKSEDRILVIGVTNRPQELDEAARRRLVKRIYIPLPDVEGRKQLVQRVLSSQRIEFQPGDFDRIAEMTDGYSGADMASLCKEAAYGPIRDVGHNIQSISAESVRPISLVDFVSALKHVKASVRDQDLDLYASWDKQFGCHV